MSKFPPRNLPGLSEVWGRSVEDHLREMRSEVGNMGASVENTARSASGQFNVVETQVDELLGRSTNVAFPSNMTVTGSAASSSVSTSQTVSFPGAGGSRLAFLTFRANLTIPSSNGFSTRHYVFIRHQGTLLMSLEPLFTVFSGVPLPNESRNLAAFQGFCRFPVASGVPTSVDLQLTRGVGATTTSAMTLNNIQMSLTLSGAA